MVTAICKICGKEFKTKPVHIRNGHGKYCSYKCAGKSKETLFIGSNNPKWRGGKIKMQDGRVAVYAPDHPKSCLFGGTHILEYRLIAEKKIGRYLNDDEIVHHVNGDPTDNRPENLEVMTQSEHAKLESIRRDSITGRFGKKVVNQ
jgi:hypothetical protein